MVGLFALLAAGLQGSPIAAAETPSQPKLNTSQEFVVGFDRGLSQSEQAALVEKQGAEVEEMLGHRTLVIAASISEAAALERRDAVRYVEPNAAVKVMAPLPPTDPQLDDMWGIKAIGAPSGWAKMTKSTEVVVAVSDTGIWAEHEDLRSRLWRNPGEISGDGIDNDRNGIVDDIHGANLSNGGQSGETNDRYGHGTHVAGTIGAEAFNDLGIVGVAPHVRLMNARFLDDNGFGQISDAVRSIDYAVANGARVINCSWGTNDYSLAVHEAIDRARAENVLVVAAAGNSRVDADERPMYPAAYPSTNVISVAATTSSGGLASFSNWGVSSVDLGAPGQLIRSAIINGGSGYNSGTSMAAPHVSGIAAVLWGERPSVSYWDIRRAILEGGSPLGSLSGKTVTGRLASLSGSIDSLAGLAPEAPPAEPAPPSSPAPTPPAPPADPNPDRRPSVVRAPEIRGSGVSPGNLYCDGGWWAGSYDVQVRWVRNGEIIGYGAGYSTSNADVGTAISCRSIAYNAFGNSTSESAPITITAAPPTPLRQLGRPSIRKASSNAFSCDQGSWDGAQRFQYSWVMRGNKIAETKKLKLKAKWRGRTVRCLVTAHGSGGTSAVSLTNSRKIPSGKR